MKIDTSYSFIWVNAIISLLQEHGLDGTEVAKGCGLDLPRLRKPTAAVGLDAMNQLWEQAFTLLDEQAGLSSCHLFGIKVAQQINLSNFGALTFAMLASANMTAAMNRFIRYVNTVCQLQVLELIEVGDTYQLSIRTSSIIDYTPAVSHYALVALMTRMVKFIDGDRSLPVKIEFSQSKPTAAEKIQQYLTTNVEYDAPINAMVFSKEVLDNTLKTADFYQSQKSDQAITRFITEYEKQQVELRVKRYVLEQLSKGNAPSAEGIAKEMGVSKRTLQRYLNVKEITFKEILDENRKKLSHLFLSEGIKSVSELTFRLGFADASSFCRAFKRWYGCSTSQYLNQIRMKKPAPEITMNSTSGLSHNGSVGKLNCVPSFSIM